MCIRDSPKTMLRDLKTVANLTQEYGPIAEDYIRVEYPAPLSDIHKENIPALLDQLHLKYTKAILYKTVVPLNSGTAMG